LLIRILAESARRTKARTDKTALQCEAMITAISAPNRWAVCCGRPNCWQPDPHGPRDKSDWRIFARRKTVAILAALEKQRAIGLDIFSDGEMRRGSWLTDMADAVDGFVSEKVTLEWKGPGRRRGGQHGASGGSEAAKKFASSPRTSCRC
jgi:hypothetical protein